MSTTPLPTPDDSQAAPSMQSVMAAAPTPLPTDITNPQPVMPELAPNSTGKVSLWKSVLAGALQGLAGASGGDKDHPGATSFGGGLARGVSAELTAQAQQAQQQQQAAQQQQQQLTQNQVQQLQLAKAQIDLASAHRQFSLMPQSKQEAVMNARIDTNDGLQKAGALVPVAATTDDYATTMDNVTRLHAADPSKFYSAEPVRGDDGNIAWQAVYHPATPIQSDVTVTNPDGSEQTIKAGTMTGQQVASVMNKAALATIQQNSASTQAATNLKQQQASVVQQNANANTVKANAAAANASGNSVYGYDPNADQTVLTTAQDAAQRGLQGVRKVNQTQIASDTHNQSVLNDVSMKANAVAQAAPALDQDGRQRDIISWALGDNGIKIGFGDHLALPMDALVNNSLNSRNMGQASDLTKQYIIGILSLRESAMGMQRVLTGSARANESQIKALQATLPGFEPNSKTAIQRLQSFGQNVTALRKPIPTIPGVPVIPINVGGNQ